MITYHATHKVLECIENTTYASTIERRTGRPRRGTGTRSTASYVCSTPLRQGGPTLRTPALGRVQTFWISNTARLLWVGTRPSNRPTTRCPGHHQGAMPLALLPSAAVRAPREILSGIAQLVGICYFHYQTRFHRNLSYVHPFQQHHPRSH